MEQAEQALALAEEQVEQPVEQAEIKRLFLPVQTLLEEKKPELQEAWQVEPCSTGVDVAQQKPVTKL